MASRAERALSFGAVAADYDRLRPGPPEAALDWLPPSACEVAVDLGAGTGLLSRALARRIRRVIAVEPDERMAAVLRSRSAGIDVRQGTAEAIPLPDASADGVFVSSAWHWMDPARAVPEISRVLRDGGRFGVIWTSRDREIDWVRDLGRPAGPPAERRDGDCGAAHGRHREIILPEAGIMRAVTQMSFPFSRMMAKRDIVDMLGTYSDVITASPQEAAAALASARVTLAERFPAADPVAVPMRSWCWRADRVSRQPPTPQV